MEELTTYELTQASRQAHPHAVYYQSQFQNVPYDLFNPWPKALRRFEVLAIAPISRETAQIVLRLIQEGRLPGWFVGSLDLEEIKIIAEET